MGRGRDSPHGPPSAAEWRGVGVLDPAKPTAMTGISLHNQCNEHQIRAAEHGRVTHPSLILSSSVRCRSATLINHTHSAYT